MPFRFKNMFYEKRINNIKYVNRKFVLSILSDRKVQIFNSLTHFIVQLKSGNIYYGKLSVQLTFPKKKYLFRCEIILRFVRWVF